MEPSVFNSTVVIQCRHALVTTPVIDLLRMAAMDKKAVKSNVIIERISLLDKKIYKLQAIRNHPKKLGKTTSTLTIERTKGEETKTLYN